ncbi:MULTISPECIES: ABC transporter substrate-binding protein [unclassified Streptomyces]|uniref:ABC transporter substrate-binding protein n=1 Tax=unclassified Streptomyces TaxID=2593676 RepID=UPI002E2021E9|nr:hypothetical protein OG217_15995 [Streptomyces sp. NBC_01023]
MSNRFREFFWYTGLRRIITSAVVLVLLAGAGIAAYAIYTPDLHCAEGVDRPEQGAECIGVNGDGYDFGRPALHDVAQAIARENRTLKKGQYATVALLLPLTSTDSDMANKVLHEAQGAFVEQYRANHDDNDQVPKIRLVLANTGVGSGQWATTVNKLKGMTGAPDQLRAVSGVATSSDATRDAVKELTRSHIPVIGTTITADDISNSAKGIPFPGLARVSPTNKDEADALKNFADIDPKKTLLVRDTHPGDHYTETLRAAFNGMLEGAPYEDRVYTSPPDQSEDGSTANTFAQITDAICSARQVNTILFAGRHTQLRQFVNALGNRICVRTKFTILTGDEGSYLGYDTKLNKKALKPKKGAEPVIVQYAALAHPGAWSKATDPDMPATGGSPADYTAFTNAVAAASGKGVGPIGPIDNASLADGQAIIAYDGMATAVTGIRRARAGSSALPDIEDVGAVWSKLQGPLRVNGASGWICLDNYGNPYDKAVAIVQLTQTGTQEFVKLAWPDKTKKPPAQECLPPRGR